MLGKIIGISSIIALCVVMILLNVTTPATIGPLGIFILFVLMYMSVAGLLTYFLFVMSAIISRLSTTVKNNKLTLKAFTIQKSYYFASVIALAPILLLGMQSVSKVSIYEFLLVAIFTSIACLYVSKRTS